MLHSQLVLNFILISDQFEAFFIGMQKEHECNSQDKQQVDPNRSYFYIYIYCIYISIHIIKYYM